MPINENGWQAVQEAIGRSEYASLCHETPDDEIRKLIEAYEAAKAPVTDQPDELPVEDIDALIDSLERALAWAKELRPRGFHPEYLAKAKKLLSDALSEIRYPERRTQQPVGLSVSDIQNAIQSAKPERIIVRQELRQRNGEPIEILHEKTEYRVSAWNQAQAVMEIIKPYLRQPEREAVTQWQPIKTAPKDGTSILSFPHYIVTHWEVGGWTSHYVGDGTEDEGDQSQWEFCTPTHWIPLPPAPDNRRRG